MNLVPLIKKPTFDPAISPNDTKNPNNTTCMICKFRYSSQQTYQKHMKNIHKDVSETPVHRTTTLTNSKIQPDPNDLTFSVDHVKGSTQLEMHTVYTFACSTPIQNWKRSQGKKS